MSRVLLAAMALLLVGCAHAPVETTQNTPNAEEPPTVFQALPNVKGTVKFCAPVIDRRVLRAIMTAQTTLRHYGWTEVCGMAGEPPDDGFDFWSTKDQRTVYGVEYHCSYAPIADMPCPAPPSGGTER